MANKSVTTVKKVEESAVDTLKPNSMPAGPDPKSKLSALAAVIGALSEVDKGDTNLFDKVQSVVVAAGRAGLDTSEKNKASISTKPSDASPSPTFADMAGQVKAAAREEVQDMFSGQELSEEFRDKAAMIFETALEARLKLEVVRIEEENTKTLTEYESQLEDKVVAKVGQHIDYVVEQWVEDNAVAIESSLTANLTREFIEGMKQLFAEHYIDIPEDKVDVVGALSKKVDELSATVEKLLGENANLKEQVGSNATDEVFDEVSKGLAATQVEKLRTLSEGIEHKTPDEFKKKLEVIRENYFKKKEGEVQPLNEGVEGTDPPKTEGTRPASMQRYVDSIARGSRR